MKSKIDGPQITQIGADETSIKICEHLRHLRIERGAVHEC
jgi:hypothetical protein